MSDILYLCDRKACEVCSPCNECKHTPDISHAKNFEKIGSAFFENTKAPIILKVDAVLPSEKMQKLREALIQQLAEGVLLIPAFMNNILVDADGITYEIKEIKKED